MIRKQCSRRDIVRNKDIREESETGLVIGTIEENKHKWKEHIEMIDRPGYQGKY